MSFFGGLFGGSNPTLNSNIGSLGAMAGSTSQQGLSDTNAASSFWQNILQGGGTKALAPEISAVMNQGQQKKQALSQFGNRGGGTNAAAQTIGDQGTSQINNMISSLMGTAANNLGSLGSNLLNTSLSATQQQTEASQMRLQNWMNGILGKALSGGIAAGESGGIGAGFGSLRGGGGAGSGAMMALMAGV